MSAGKCAICGARARPCVDEIADYEYGVPWRSKLVSCTECGLVWHDPPIAAAEISRLYPADYTAFRPRRPGSIYSRIKQFLDRMGARKLARHLPSGGLILEVGCGNGEFLRVIHSIRPDARLMGVDIEDVPKPVTPHIEFLKGQLEQIQIRGDTCDIIYASNLIEHVADPVAFVGCCHKLLRDGGALCLVTPSTRSIDRMIFGRYWGGYHYPRHTYLFDDRNLRSLLSNVGFQDVKVSGSHAYWYISMANWLKPGHAKGQRGLLFALVSAAFLPLDVMLNLFWPHGSMSVIAMKRAAHVP